MNKTYTLLILLILIITSKSNAQENEPRFFSINYYQRVLFIDFEQFAAIQNAELPRLKKNARFHGMKLEGTIMNNIIIGLYANGSLNDSKNNFGYTSWGGGIGVVTIDYRYNLKPPFFTSLGFGLGCGRFTYSSASWDGTASITSNTDAIVFEPNIDIGYIFKKKLILTFEVSYMLDLGDNEYAVGAGNVPHAFPKGFIIGASIGAKFPPIKRKKN